MKELLTQILETARHLTERLGRLHERLDALKYLVRDLNGGSAPDDRLVDVHEVAGRLDCSRKNLPLHLSTIRPRVPNSIHASQWPS